MKSIVILYESNSKFGDEKSFNGKSAKELCESKVSKLDLEIVKIPHQKNLISLLTAIKNAGKEKQADYVIFSFDDLPFYNESLSQKMRKTHEEYKAEYTFADGYPYGYSPEIIDCGALGILEEMAATNHKEIGDKPVERDSIYNLLKTEINNFEVEAVLADGDYRLLRLAFHTGKKENYLSSLALFNKAGDMEDCEKLSEIASKTPEVLKTVPGFYNIQLADYVSNNAIYSPYNGAYEKLNCLSPLKSNKVMAYEDFSRLIDKIAAFSDTAVVSLSAWGEPFAHKDILKMVEKVLSYEGLSVFIETDGTLITEETAKQLELIRNNAAQRTNGWDKLMIAVALDGVTENMYKTVHNNCNEDDFNKALASVTLLSAHIPGSVYPQFTRMNENESELESFFRYWNEKTNCTGGNFIINKYDDFAGLLPQRKPADLSPIERDPCWHIRRDMTILTNGDVPLCRAYVLSNIQGNAFRAPLEDIWAKLNNTLKEHIDKKYNEKCGKCDEYYTFNF